MYKIKFLKLFFILFLIGTFVVLIAYESVRKYLNKGIVVEVSYEMPEKGLKPPAITFCSAEPNGT